MIPNTIVDLILDNIIQLAFNEKLECNEDYIFNCVNGTHVIAYCEDAELKMLIMDTQQKKELIEQILIKNKEKIFDICKTEIDKNHNSFSDFLLSDNEPRFKEFDNSF